MRIVGPNATARASTPSAARRAASGGFSVAEQEAPRSGSAAAALRTVGGIDALIALQGQEELAERRERGVRRGRNALDALDELKAELLGGGPGPSTLARLKSANTQLLDATGDVKLDAVLAEIELRLAVEIAKLTPR